MTLPILSVGGHGIISVAGHVVGAEIKDMVNAFPTDPARARRIHQRLAPVFKALFSAPSPAPVKYALSRRGFDCEEVRLPVVKLSDEERNVVDAAMTRFAGATAVA